MAFISGQITSKVETNINKKFINAIKSDAKRRVAKLPELITNLAKDIVEEHLLESEVVKSLRGEYAGDDNGNDLQAEFGLTEQMAEYAVNSMFQILKETVDVIVIPESDEITTGRELIKVRVKAFDEEQYESVLKYGQGFHYSNKAMGGNIDFEVMWMKWLLEGADSMLGEIPDIEEYGITYALDSIKGKFKSRSGRAIMTSSEDLADRFPYNFPRIAIPRGAAKNFIDQIARSKEFRSVIREKVKNLMERTLKSKSIRK